MPSRHTQASEVIHQQPLTGIHILLVEDEPDMMTLLVFVLEAEGAIVSTCTDAETALSILEFSQPDILMSNIRLPEQNGIWLIQHIRQHSHPEIRQIPVIGITSYDRETSAEQALNAGFDCFLSKLDPPEALTEAIYTLTR
ncbi:response regulator [Cyanobacteria bacterium FACHB-63]|nr:response regulator [Cyanobacteria bacterium FACHB-63]